MKFKYPAASTVNGVVKYDEFPDWDMLVKSKTYGYLTRTLQLNVGLSTEQNVNKDPLSQSGSYSQSNKSELQSAQSQASAIDTLKLSQSILQVVKQTPPVVNITLQRVQSADRGNVKSRGRTPIKIDLLVWREARVVTIFPEQSKQG